MTTLEMTAVAFGLFAVASAIAQRSTVIHTTLGPIQGLRKSVKGQPVDIYYGIPFAKPPLEDLRFKHPEPAEPWTEVKDTVTKPNSCFQEIATSFNKFPGVEMWNPNTHVSEDCLYLNVWLPRGLDSKVPKATMVWLYGGAFVSGSSTLDVYDGSNLAATENVIVATVNYRVGPLGFFYTASDDAPGNQGMMDQVMALKWVYDNVANFGGSKETITLFGESAGAISVGMHLLSPLSMDYFARAIMQSGSPTASYAVQSMSEAAANAHTVATTVGCPLEPISEMVKCLRQVDAKSVTRARQSVASGSYKLPFTPIVDGYFLPGDPKDLLARGEVKNTEIILGTNKDEGMYFLIFKYPEYYPLDNSGQLSRSDLEDVMKGLFPKGGQQKQTDALMYEYVDSVVPNHRDSYRNIGDDAWGDMRFICRTVDFAMAYLGNVSAGRSVYLYSFEHRLSNNPWPAWTGVMHAYEIEAVFGLPLEYNYTSEEEALASRVTGYWTRFAESGDPTGSHSSRWPRMTSQGLEYLKITTQGDTVEQGLRHQQCSFLRHVLPLLEKESSTPEKPSCQTGGQRTMIPSFQLMCFTILLAAVFLSV